MSVKKRALTNEEMNSAAGGRVEERWSVGDPGPEGFDIGLLWVIDDKTNKPIAAYENEEDAEAANKAYHRDGTVLQKGMFTDNERVFERSTPF